MTYSEKLKDFRWLAFRQDFIDFITLDGSAPQCSDCGRGAGDSLHVHHRRYVKGREPWDYEFSDLRLVCEQCHHRIHDLEQRVRAFILTMEPHQCNEFNDVMDELEREQKNGLLKVALAHAKNGIRGMTCDFESSDERVRDIYQTSARLILEGVE